MKRWMVILLMGLAGVTSSKASWLDLTSITAEPSGAVSAGTLDGIAVAGQMTQRQHHNEF